MYWELFDAERYLGQEIDLKQGHLSLKNQLLTWLTNNEAKHEQAPALRLAARLGLSVLSMDKGHVEAKASLETLLTDCKNHLGGEHELTTTVSCFIAFFHDDRNEDARDQLENASKQCEGLKSELTLEVGWRLATLQSCHPEDVRNLEKLVKSYEDNFGSKDPLTLKARFVLANVSWNRGRPDGENRLKAVVEDYEKELGPTCVKTLKARESLALFYANFAWQEAQQALETIAEECEKELGLGNAITVRVLTELAQLALDLENEPTRSQHLKKLESVLETTSLDPDHQTTLRARSIIGRYYCVKGDSRAEPLLKELPKLCKKLLGQSPTHTDILKDLLRGLERAPEWTPSTEDLVQLIRDDLQLTYELCAYISDIYLAHKMMDECHTFWEELQRECVGSWGSDPRTFVVYMEYCAAIAPRRKDSNGVLTVIECDPQLKIFAEAKRLKLTSDTLESVHDIMRLRKGAGRYKYNLVCRCTNAGRAKGFWRAMEFLFRSL